jgi:hypothetical protein
MQVFERDCLIPLGTAIAPVGGAKPGEQVATASIAGGGLRLAQESIQFGELYRHELSAGQTATVRIEPARGFDVGEGKGKPREVTVRGGVVGLLIDARGRPLQLPSPSQRSGTHLRWLAALGL